MSEFLGSHDLRAFPLEGAGAPRRPAVPGRGRERAQRVAGEESLGPHRLFIGAVSSGALFVLLLQATPTILLGPCRCRRATSRSASRVCEGAGAGHRRSDGHGGQRPRRTGAEHPGSRLAGPIEGPARRAPCRTRRACVGPSGGDRNRRGIHGSPRASAAQRREPGTRGTARHGRCGGRASRRASGSSPSRSRRTSPSGRQRRSRCRGRRRTGSPGIDRDGGSVDGPRIVRRHVDNP